MMVRPPRSKRIKKDTRTPLKKKPIRSSPPEKPEAGSYYESTSKPGCWIKIVSVRAKTITAKYVMGKGGIDEAGRPSFRMMIEDLRKNYRS